jgi:predicted nucleotidyltransferase
MLREKFRAFLERLLEEVKHHYGGRLVSLVVFGSVGRGTARFDSDVDLLVVAEGLPPRRLKRMEDFEEIERALEKDLRELAECGIHTSLSPIIKTKEEVKRGSPLFLDMIEDGLLLYDRDGFFRSFLEGFAQRLEALGALRVRKGNSWYWVLKGDYRGNEVFEL